MSSLWLPPELWENVFSLATNFPGEFDIREWISRNEKGIELPSEEIDLRLARINITGKNSNQFLLLQNPNFHIQRSLRRKLILVCKSWYEMGLKYLYGSIVIYDSSTLSGCIETLKRTCDLARIVRRLEVYLDNPENEEDCEITSRRQLAELIELCPNITLFAAEIEECEGADSQALTYARLSLRGTLSTHCKHLRHAIGTHIIDGYPARNFFRAVSPFTNLIALKLPPSIATIPGLERPAITLPNVRILDIGYQVPLISPEFGGYLSRWSLPSLEAVHLGTLSASMALGRFWATHGSKLKTIRIYNASDFIFDSRLVDINLGITSPPDQLFPNLRQLVILHNTPAGLIRLFLPSTSLEIYEVPLHGLWRPNDRLTSYLERQVELQHMRPLLNYAIPNLRIVRISRCPSASDKSERGIRCNSLLHHWVPVWRDEFGRQNVVLEQMYGD